MVFQCSLHRGATYILDSLKTCRNEIVIAPYRTDYISLSEMMIHILAKVKNNVYGSIVQINLRKIVRLYHWLILHCYALRSIDNYLIV